MSTSIDGIYAANDGGQYYLRFVGSENGGRLFWFGEHPDGHFANVMVGELNVFGNGHCNVPSGRWWDVPKGGATSGSVPGDSESELELDVANGIITKSRDSARGFGGSRWAKHTGVARRAAINLMGFAGEGLTGIWRGNDGGIYFVRQTPAGVAWFGQQCSAAGALPAFANVFAGTRAGNIVSGSWADVPYGSAAGAGDLELSVDGNRMVRTRVTGGFAGNEWTRVDVNRHSVISALEIRVTTASRIASGRNPDDLRQGSVAWGTVALSGGRTLPRVNLNEGRVLNPGRTDSTTIGLPPGTRIRDVESFVLELDGAPRNSEIGYDNWDLGSVEIGFRLDGSPCSTGRLLSRSGEPLQRLTGELPSLRLALT